MKNKVIKIILLCILVLLVWFCQMPTSFNINNTTEDYSHLFKDIYYKDKNFGNVPISKIAMLGSHDALSSNISYFSKTDTTRQKTNKDNYAANPFIFYLVKGGIVRLSRAQSEGVYNQFKAGSRFIDVRITDIDGEFYNSHGLIADRFENNLLQILKFLDENPGEFIFFSILYYYQDTRSWDEMCDYMKSVEYNGHNIFDYVNYDLLKKDYSSITYNDVTSNGTKAGVVFVSKSYEGSKYADYFALNKILNTNCKVGNYHKLDSIINGIVDEAKKYDDSYLKINQTQITPDLEDILSVLANWSLLNISDKHNSEVIKIGEYREWFEGMPIFLTDNVTSSKSDFNHVMNEYIIEYNLELASQYKGGQHE